MQDNTRQGKYSLIDQSVLAHLRYLYQALSSVADNASANILILDTFLCVYVNMIFAYGYFTGRQKHFQLCGLDGRELASALQVRPAVHRGSAGAQE